MKTFRYKAVNDDGVICKGKYQCSNSKELVSYLYSRNQHLIEIQHSIKVIDLGMKMKIRLKELSFFCRQIGAMLESGIPIMEVMKITSFQVKKGRIYDNCIHIMTSLRRGASLFEAMKTGPNIFPEFMLHMVKIGEDSGKLPHMFDSLSKYYYKESKIRNKVTGAAAYPVFVLAFTLIAAIVLLTTIVPSMMGMVVSMGGEIPLITEIVMSLSIFLNGNILFITIFISISALISYWCVRKGAVSLDLIKRKLPLVRSIYLKRSNYNFLYAVYLMICGGSTIVDALEGAAKVLKDHYFKEQVEKAAFQIRQGGNVIEALISIEVIDFTSLSIIKLGEETGKLKEMLARLISILEDELNTMLEKVLELIQPVAIIMVGLVVGTIVIAIALPMFSMYNI